MRVRLNNIVIIILVLLLKSAAKRYPNPGYRHCGGNVFIVLKVGEGRVQLTRPFLKIVFFFVLNKYAHSPYKLPYYIVEVQRGRLENWSISNFSDRSKTHIPTVPRLPGVTEPCTYILKMVVSGRKKTTVSSRRTIRRSNLEVRLGILGGQVYYQSDYLKPYTIFGIGGIKNISVLHLPI